MAAQRPPTVKRIIEWFDLEHYSTTPEKHAKEIRESIQKDRAHDTLTKVDKLINAHGIEVIRGEDGIVAHYVNTGDTYNPTLLYDVNQDKFYLTTWGDWVERYNRKYKIDQVMQY